MTAAPFATTALPASAIKAFTWCETKAYRRPRSIVWPLNRRHGSATRPAWQAHLDRLGLTALKVTPAPVQAATEGALWGSVQADEFLCDAVILSDDAGQFNIGRHALCWVHAERLVHKLDTFNDQHHAAQTWVRGLIWDFYADLKAYQLKPGKRRARALRARFDRIFLGHTGFVTPDRLLARLHGNKAELLMVLERPEIPLHTNGSENDIRCYVTRRKISAGTRSESDGIAATRSSVSPRPVTNWASQSGIIWATGSKWWARRSLNRSTIMSGRDSAPHDWRPRQ